jgi:hypothetical protein
MPQGGTVAELQWVDLERGRRLAALSHDVRDARKAKGLITPIVDMPSGPTHAYDPTSGALVELSDEFTDADAAEWTVAEQADGVAAMFATWRADGKIGGAPVVTVPDRTGLIAGPLDRMAQLVAGADAALAEVMAADDVESFADVPPPCCDQFHPAGTTCPDPFLSEDEGESYPGELEDERAALEDGPPIVDPADLAAVKLGVPVEDVLDTTTELEVEQAVNTMVADAARAHGDECDCFGCEDGEGNRTAPPVPVAHATLVLRAIERGAARRELLVKLWHVEAQAEAVELWRVHLDIWTPDHDKAVVKRLAELAAPPAAVAS